MEVPGGTEKAGKPPGAKGRGRIRIRALQAAVGAALLEAVPGGSEVAHVVGFDPVSHAKRRMLKDIGTRFSHGCAGGGSSARPAPQVAKQATRGLIRAAKGVLRGTRYAGILARRGFVIVTVVSSVVSGISAYREMTAVGFAALGDPSDPAAEA